MSKTTNKQKDNRKGLKGFTIIEVVLVLAIAGLIFLMVFVAFPALQRSQNDTQRQNDIARLSTQITNFKTNNRNSIPGKAKASDGKTAGVLGHTTKSATTWGATPGTWGYFYDNYMLAGGDTFQDPDGNPYGLKVVYCAAEGATSGKPMGALKDGASCTNTAAQRSSMEFSAQSQGSTSAAKITDSYGGTATYGEGHSILIVLGARCNGETSVAASGANDLALLYKREGGGTICIAN